MNKQNTQRRGDSEDYDSLSLNVSLSWAPDTLLIKQGQFHLHSAARELLPALWYVKQADK